MQSPPRAESDALDFRPRQPLATRPGDDTVEELIAYYRALSGEHENWDDYRAAMVTDRRAVVRLTPVRAYGTLS